MNDTLVSPTAKATCFPFPVSALPSAVGAFVAASAAAIGCDPSFVGLPLLVCLARAIGNKRVVRLKRTWTEPAIIWAAIVGKSGTHKSPALQAAMQFLQRRQTDAFAQHAEAVAQYEQEQAHFERDFAAWNRSKKGDPPRAPAPPVCQRYVTSDATIEALAALLALQFDGLLVCRDELAGWLDGIAEYKGGKGSDKGHWLSAWNAAPLIIDRKTGAVRTLYIPRATVSLVGGIQPGVLRTAIGREHMQDGLCARLLLTMPEPRPVRWTEATVSPEVEAAMGAVFDKLLALEQGADGGGAFEPLAMELMPEAKTLWRSYFNHHRAEQADLDDDLAAAWSKLEAYTARFALIFQLCSWAAGDADGDAIDEATLAAAIALSDWFGAEAKRVYGLFIESDDDRERRELAELIQRKGGAVTARQLAHGSRRYRSAGEAEAALNDLVAHGRGSWRSEPTKGRPRFVFVLNLNNTGNGNGTSAKPANSVLPLPLPPSHSSNDNDREARP